MLRITARLEYNPKTDGNVFIWILSAAETYRHIRKEYLNALKKAAAESKKLDGSKMADQKWQAIYPRA